MGPPVRFPTGPCRWPGPLRRYVTYPGPLGQRIYENVSKEGWQRWVRHQTMLLNEYRLTPIDPKARQFLVAEMEKFFFGGGSDKPKEFVPPS